MRRTHLFRGLASGAVATVLVCGVAMAGMAELGQRRNLNLLPGPESGSDLAQGGGAVVITVNGQPFSHSTIPGEPVSTILQDLTTQINLAPDPFFASHQAGAGEMTVLERGGDVSRLDFRSSDPAFGFVRVIRSVRGAVAVRNISQPPAGDGLVQIIVDDQIDRAATVDTADHVGDADSLNDALVVALRQQGFEATRAGNYIRVTRDLQLDQPPEAVSLEESDTGIPTETITEIQVLSEDVGGDAQDVPTLSPWALVLQALLLGGTMLYVLRRRQRA